MKSQSTIPQIVEATTADLPAIANLAGVIWRAYYPGIISEAQIEYMLGKMYAHATLRAEVESQQIRYVRLLVAGELVGFASFGPTDRPEVGKLHKIYLHPRVHNQGLGSLLLLHCAEQVRQVGARQLTLTVNKGNKQAINAYERNGFGIVKSVVSDFGNGFLLDDYVMVKPLPPQASPGRLLSS